MINPPQYELPEWHQDLFDTWLRAYDSGSFPQAVCLSAPKGVGKAEFVWFFLKKILGDSFWVEGEIVHPACHWITPEQDKKTPVIGIEASRALRSSVLQQAQQSDRHWVVIEQANTLSLGAEAALLKTLEEPPTPTSFILLCQEPSQIAQTIRSRCVLQRLPMCAKAQGWRWLEAQDLKGVRPLTYRLALHKPLLVEQWLRGDDKNLKTYQETLRDWLACAKGQLSGSEFASKHSRDPIEVTLYLLVTLLRDVLAYRLGAGTEQLIYQSAWRELLDWIRQLKVEKLTALYREILAVPVHCRSGYALHVWSEQWSQLWQDKELSCA